MFIQLISSDSFRMVYSKPQTGDGLCYRGFPINEVNHLQTICSGDFFTSQREVFIFHSGHISYYIPLDPITPPFLLVKSTLLIIKSPLLIVQSYFCCKIPEFSISLVLII